MMNLLRLLAGKLEQYRWRWRQARQARMAPRLIRRGVFPKVKNTEETLQMLEQTQLSFARFGDSEVLIILGLGRYFQRADRPLRRRMRKVLKSRLDCLAVGVPDIFQGTAHHGDNQYFYKDFIDAHRVSFQSMLDMKKQYYDAAATRVFSETPPDKHPEAGERLRRFRQLWEGRNLLFIEGEHTRMGFGNDYFDNARSIVRVIGPAANAFDRYRDIRDFVLAAPELEPFRANPRENIAILALGPTAKVLAYDLAKAGFRALDFGHLDVEYEWYLNGDGRIYLPHKHSAESPNNTLVEIPTDEAFERQVIARFL